MAERRQERVAVIGAGVSGLTAAKHLCSFGIRVSIFERPAAVGGIWHFDERRPPEPQYPSIIPSVSDSHHLDGSKMAEIEHAPPGPSPTTNQRHFSSSKDTLGRGGLEIMLAIKLSAGYLRVYAAINGLGPLIKFNTRVQGVEKVGQKWVLRSSALKNNELTHRTSPRK
ncbi:hypothetical protein BDV12DRAFT_197020 [Aspergillus spectabilis]